jgi:3-deoxy-D-manno-octulosonic-acid transferase
LTRSIYSLLFYIILPGIWVRVLWRSFKEPAYRRNPLQRLGFVRLKKTSKPTIWVHAVSAGETNAIAPLVSRLLSREYRVVMTSMTPTGRERVAALLGDQVESFYVPYDLPGAVKRFLGTVSPDLLVIVDTELWPNMLHHCRAAGVKVVLANARLSERSARGYQRISRLSGRMMDDVSVVAAQSEAQGKRFIELGLDPVKMKVLGSVKFDQELPTDFKSRTAELNAMLADCPRLIAASTHAGEEALLLEAFAIVKQSHPELQLIIAPRHTHRAAEVEALCTNAGFAVARRTSHQPCTDRDTILLLDTMGELGYAYGAADIAFVGGSLVPVGGHNFIEAVMAGAAVVMGPHLDDVKDIAAQLIEANGMLVVDSTDELLRGLLSLVAEPSQRAAFTTRALDVCRRNRGAIDGAEALIVDLVK